MHDRDEIDDFIIRQVYQLPLTAERIALETRKDQQLGKTLQLLESGNLIFEQLYPFSTSPN